MLFQTPRGTDGTGMAGIREGYVAGKKETIINTYKRELHYIDFMGLKATAKFMEKFSDYYYMIGHVRASTVGNDDARNAHPFEYNGPAGRYVLVHNGTVDKSGLTKADEFVDSAHITATMAEKGEIETLEKLDGGYSLVWYNSKDDTLNFARNDRKPMAIAFIKKSNTLYYASEYSTLWNVLVRNQLDIDGQIQIPKPGVHYKFYKEDLRAFDKEGFKIYSKPFINPPHNSYDETWRGGTKAIVHRGSTKSTPQQQDTPSSAPASIASTSSNQSTTSEGNVGHPTIHPNFLDPKPERIALIDKLIAPHGYKHGQVVVLKATGWESWQRTPYKGTIHMEKVNNHKPEMQFRVVFAERATYDAWIADKKEVACRICNLMEIPSSNNITLAVRQDEDMQGVIDRHKDTIMQLDANGFAYDSPNKSNIKEDPKSTFAAKDPPNDDMLLDDSNGSKITYKRFKEICLRNCGCCSSPLDPLQYDTMSWMNGEPVCTECTIYIHRSEDTVGKVH